jgi:hypothetical protein
LEKDALEDSEMNDSMFGLHPTFNLLERHMTFVNSRIGVVLDEMRHHPMKKILLSAATLIDAPVEETLRTSSHIVERIAACLRRR